FAKCMHNHEGPKFSDPSREGGSVHETIARGSGVDASSSQFSAEMNACAAGPATPSPSGPPAVAVATDCPTLPTPRCYTPMQLRVAYGIEPLLDRGITGRGQTVVLPEFPPLAGSASNGTGDPVPASSDIRQDLALFDSMFHLPAARLQVANGLADAA